MNIREQTISGILWSAVAQFGQQGVRFAIGIILARLLTPKEFGLIGMVTVFSGFASLFGEMGFGAAIIQKQNVEERHLSSIFWLNVAAGVFLAGLMAACSPLIARFYREPILVPLTIVISLNFVVGSFNRVQDSLLTKTMNFRRLAIIDTAAVSVSGVVAAAMAFAGLGVWSLVTLTLIRTTLQAIIMWSLSDWKPRLIWDWKAVKDLLGFSANLLGFRVSNYWMSNIDNLLIGKYVSAAALGVYDRAFNLMLLPLTQVSPILSRVMFPALSIIQDERKKIKQIFLRANRAIALISFPIMMGLLVVARSFILTLYGEKWDEVILILEIFCISGLIRSIGTNFGWIYLSQGRTDLQLRWGIFAGVVRVTSIVIGLRWGPVGVATAIVLSGCIVLWYPAWTIPGRLINLTFREMVNDLKSLFFCATAMAAAVLMLGFLLPAVWPHWARLATQVPFGIAVYALLLHFLKIKAYQEVRELAIEQWRGRYSKPRD